MGPRFVSLWACGGGWGGGGRGAGVLPLGIGDGRPPAAMAPPAAAATVSFLGSGRWIANLPGPAAAARAARAKLVRGSSNPPLAANGPLARCETAATAMDPMIIMGPRGSARPVAVRMPPPSSVALADMALSFPRLQPTDSKPA